MSTTPNTETNQQADCQAGACGTPAPAETGKGIELTEFAATKVRDFMGDADPKQMYLFVGVKGGGCSGLQYVLDLRNEPEAPINESDEVFESHGIRVVCDLKSFIVGNLGGTTIDYKDGMMGAGFTFDNPNARSTCGCGSSYSA